jgi:hypothetical protein
MIFVNNLLRRLKVAGRRATIENCLTAGAAKADGADRHSSPPESIASPASMPIRG